MAKTIQQLEDELAKVSGDTRRAYDILHGTEGSFDPGLLRQLASAKETLKKKGLFESARLEAETAIKTLEPKIKAAEIKYKTFQDQKNALNKELKAFKAQEQTNKTNAATAKGAANVYKNALDELDKADLSLEGYKGNEKYINAYRKAQEAYNALTKSGITPNVALPEAKITIPVIEEKTALGPDGKPVKEPTITEFIATITDPKNKQLLIDVQKDLAANFGYKGPVDGKPSKYFMPALQKAYTDRAGLPEAWRGTDFRSFLANPSVEGTAGTAGNAPIITDYPVISSLTDAEKIINDTFQTSLKRDATAAEIKLLYPLLKKAQLDNPTSYKTQTVNGKQAKVQYSGLDTGQWILDQLNSNKKLNLKSELETVKNEAPDLAKRLNDKKIYDGLIAKAAGDPAKLQAALDTTAYGRGLKEFKAALASSAFSKGLTNTADELNAIAEQLYNQGVAANSQVATDAIAKIAKYGTNKEGRYTGTAGTTFDDLQKTAVANGLDINKAFGSNLNDWIAAIDKGESVDTYKRIIREAAKIGMPENVKKLLDSGVDLQAIYTPYKNLMANTLEINPQTITLNDPTLRSAITADKEVPLYEFERQLRKDNRWQYTTQANKEVGDATQQILRDFGFMG
jgi:hypothetical protein